MSDEVQCLVTRCRKDGTEELERGGAIVALVCPEHHAEIEADDWVGWTITERRGRWFLEKVVAVDAD